MSRRPFFFRRDLRLRAVAIALSIASGSAGAYQWDDEPAPSRAAPPEDTAFRAALAACATEQGLPPPDAGPKPQAKAKGDAPPRRPDREKMDACLRGKGFEPPHMRGHGAPPPPPPEAEDD